MVPGRLGVGSGDSLTFDNQGQDSQMAAVPSRGTGQATDADVPLRVPGGDAGLLRTGSGIVAGPRPGAQGLSGGLGRTFR